MAIIKYWKEQIESDIYFIKNMEMEYCYVN